MKNMKLKAVPSFETSGTNNFYSGRQTRGSEQGQPLGWASGAFAPGAEFEGAPKRRSPTGHTSIRSTVARLFPHLQTKRVAKDFFKFGCISFSLF
jgi:hypothetical protein